MEIGSNNGALGARLKAQGRTTDNNQEENGQIGASEEASKAGASLKAGSAAAVTEAGQTDTFSQSPGSIREMQEANAHNNVDRVAQFQQQNS